MRAATYAVTTLLAITSQPALGATVQVNFAGSVDSITGFPSPNYGVGTPLSQAESEVALGGSIHIGTLFSGFVQYDDADIPSDGQTEAPSGPPPGPPGDPYPSWGLYYFPSPYYPDFRRHSPPIGPNAATHGEIGGFVGGESNDLIMEVYDNELLLQNARPSEVLLEAGTWAGPPSGGSGSVALIGFIAWVVGNGPGSPLHSTSLVGIPWSIENFPGTTVDWEFRNDQTNIRVSGAVAVLVPEPAAAGLVALAACAMLAAWRKPDASQWSARRSPS